MKLKSQIPIKQKVLTRTSFVEDFYDQKRKVIDKRFGQISIWSKRRGEDILLMKTNGPKKFEKTQQEIIQAQERMRLNHDYLMQMVDFSVIKSDAISFEVRNFYRAPLQDLKKEASRRKKLGK